MADTEVVWQGTTYDGARCRIIKVEDGYKFQADARGGYGFEDYHHPGIVLPWKRLVRDYEKLKAVAEAARKIACDSDECCMTGINALEKALEALDE